MTYTMQSQDTPPTPTGGYALETGNSGGVDKVHSSPTFPSKFLSSEYAVKGDYILARKIFFGSEIADEWNAVRGMEWLTPSR
mgnify:CR=1 FL=1